MLSPDVDKMLKSLPPDIFTATVWFMEETVRKVHRGYVEHGGDINKINLTREVIGEMIDGGFYSSYKYLADSGQLPVR